MTEIVDTLVTGLEAFFITFTISSQSHGLELIQVDSQTLQISIPVGIICIETNNQVLPSTLVDDTVAHHTHTRTTSTEDNQLVIL